MDNKSAWQSFIEVDALLAEKTSEQVVKYSLGSENTALYCCILWPGMLLWANDVRDKYLPANEDVDTSFVTINYCLEGRCEASAGGRDVFVYMKPGMLCIDNHRPPDGYHYPSACPASFAAGRRANAHAAARTVTDVWIRLRNLKESNLSTKVKSLHRELLLTKTGSNYFDKLVKHV